MRTVDIIRKKRDGGELSREELAHVVDGYTKSQVPDYQVSAFLMAVYFAGLSETEVADLTDVIMRSGVVLDLSAIPGVKVDKHSTGGVGDKTSLIVAPVVAAAGVLVPMISGRGLGHTGGTLDKLESIPGFNTRLTTDEVRAALSTVGAALVGQTDELAPADRALYSLRDASGTVESIPLIAASIMSKKMVEGIDALVLDVKTGSGAFMKKQTDARRLAQAMVSIGRRMNKRVLALITDMDQPLGNAVGNSLEVMEAINTLRNQGPPDLTELCVELSARMLMLADSAKTYEQAREQCQALLENGQALEKFKQMVAHQGGDVTVIDAFEKLPTSSAEYSVTSPRGGFVSRIQAEDIGTAAMLLGAGREKVDSKIDYGVGIVLERKVGERVESGDTLCTLYYNSDEHLEEATQMVEDSFRIAAAAPEAKPLIYEIIQ
jgi:pyrimidine-nucleoside phosphorylase/thymidine phosphorylase